MDIFALTMLLGKPVGGSLDWTTTEGLLFCRRHSLGILWCSNIPVAKKYEFIRLCFIDIYWLGECSHNGNHLLLPCYFELPSVILLFFCTSIVVLTLY